MKEKQNQNERARAGGIASAVGIALNFILAVAKTVVGALTGILSLVADGLNNLTDCGGSVVSLVSFRIAAKPADKEHPFGHRRAEYVATMMIAFFVLLLAVELLGESITRISEGGVSKGGVWVYAVLAASLVVKGGMCVYFSLTAKKISSDTLKAAATDSACDCLATLSVLIGVLLSDAFALSADGWVGIIVAAFIGWQGISILLEASSKLIGQAPDPALIVGVKQRVLAREGVLGLHDLHVYSYGPGKYFASVHIEVDANTPVLVAHELIDDIEREFAEETEVLLTGHLDPIVVDDERTNALRERVLEAVKGHSLDWNIHDFRVVWGENLTKVLFDITVPFACERADAEVASLAVHAVREMGAFDPIVTVERE